MINQKMESKTVILSVLITSLFMAQIQVDALRDCCPTINARNRFNVCRLAGSMQQCAALSGCKIVDGTCPGGYDYGILENTGNAVNEYCKVGCASSVCGALLTLQNSDASEIVNKAVEKCAMACSTICTKGSITEVEKTA